MIIFRRKSRSSKLGFGQAHPVVTAMEGGAVTEYDTGTRTGEEEEVGTGGWTTGTIHTAFPSYTFDPEAEGVPRAGKDAVRIPEGCTMLVSDATYDTAELAKQFALNTWVPEYTTKNTDTQATECGGTQSSKNPAKYVAYLIVCPTPKKEEEKKTSYWPWIAGGLGLLALGGIMIYATSGKKGR